MTHCDIQVKNNTLLINSQNNNEANFLYFYGLSHTLDSFDTDQDIFIGPYRNIDNPRALEDGKCSRSQSSNNPIAVLQKNITLGGSAVSELAIVAGAVPIDAQSSSFQQAKSISTRRAETILEKYRRVNAIDKALDQVGKNWQAIESRSSFKTPDETFNLIHNVWAKHQNIQSANKAHSLSVTASAAKQIVVLSNLNPELAQEQLLELFTRQLKEGNTLDWIDNSSSYSHIGHDTEGAAWLIIATSSVINETGNISLLKERVNYFDGPSGSIHEHIIRAIRHCMSQLNSNHLVEEQGESTVRTATVALAIKEILPILSSVNEHDFVRGLQQRLEQIKTSFNRRMWDGSWYLAKRNSTKIGSKKNLYRKIDGEAQIWSVISGLASQQRSEKALNMYWRQCNSAAGLANFHPSFPKYQQENPESANTAGQKDNGGINLSLAALAIIAETKTGRGELAEKVLEQHSFGFYGANQERFKNEPYIYPAFIHGPSSPNFGRAQSSWDKNPGGWLYKTFVERILGVRPVINGLKIDPCIPKNWRQVELTRQFRGANYHIRIINPTRQNQGVERVVVDGIRQNGNVVQPFKTGDHFIEIFLG